MAAIFLFIAGCTINSVKPLPAGDIADTGRAVIVYGVKVEGAWRYDGFTVQLAEYGIGMQNITGDCFHFNRADASVATTPAALKYFAFDVPPGHYVYSPFNGAPLAGDFFAFEAPAGQTVYLGDFIFKENRSVALVRNIDAVKSEIDTALPGLKERVTLSKTTPAKPPRPFLCTP